MIALFLWLTLRAEASVTEEPLAVTRTSLHVEKSDPLFGRGVKLILETRRYADVTVHVLSQEGRARRGLRRVVAASTAREVGAEMDRWIRRIGRARGGLDDLGCTRPLGTELARVRAAMCLTALAPSERRQFFAWFDRVASLAR